MQEVISLSRTGVLSSQETRVRVLEMARSMGYRLKSPTGIAPSKAIRTIGLLVKSSPDDEPHENHFYSHIITGVEAACRQMGINMMFANLPVKTLAELLARGGMYREIYELQLSDQESFHEAMESLGAPAQAASQAREQGDE